VAHSPLDTPLRKRSDDDQEMKISAVRSFCVAGGGRAAKQGQAHSGHEKEDIVVSDIVVDSIIIVRHGLLLNN
jgi:hypothetical protein